ncbi:MAG TPA: UDP-N-acetylmuramoyl-L-alanyl-D-glutamate--2,6-diaminopimelate ligase, partial [Rikenellaceae bacterium]|nr:UDP-N-acetylmuramoyl-L-alanyl-D-glutamate--2,6-diaminopimelate ligase [Rikenellaceae bacterium]
MKLENIIKNAGVIEVRGSRDIEITDICNDSRTVTPGAIFIAVKGHDSDGHAYIGKALASGAAAIVYEDEEALKKAASEYSGSAPVLVKVGNSRHAVAMMAADFFGNPSRKLNLVGITGTNGKTTTVTLLYRLFMAQGYNCGLLSTIANFVGIKRIETTNTTADPITINRLMSEMADAGCEFCFMEV